MSHSAPRRWRRPSDLPTVPDKLIGQPLVNGGTAAILFCFACLYLSTAGGGPLSVDAAAGVPDRHHHSGEAQFSGAAE